MLLDGSLNTNLEMFWQKFKSLLTVKSWSLLRLYVPRKITNKFGKHGGNDCGVTGSNPESVY